jgi:hypothetical protein
MVSLCKAFPAASGKTVTLTLAALSEARTVFALSNTGVVGSNPTPGMDVCVRLFSV